MGDGYFKGRKEQSGQIFYHPPLANLITDIDPVKIDDIEPFSVIHENVTEIIVPVVYAGTVHSPGDVRQVFEDPLFCLKHLTSTGYSTVFLEKVV